MRISNIFNKILISSIISGVLGWFNFTYAASLSCANIQSYAYKQDDILLFPLANQPTQRYYLLVNKAQTPIFIDQSPHIPAAQAGWASQLEPGHYSILAMNKKSFGIACGAIDHRGNHSVNCADTIQICQLKMPIAIEHTRLQKGSYWVEENIGQSHIKH